MTDAPDAIARKQVVQGDALAIVDDCPHCGKRHTHGYPEEFPSYRVAHCADANPTIGYNLVLE